MGHRIEIDSLLRLSARIGNDPSLIQASNGNTSIKLGSTMWVKGSGRWLAHAQRGEDQCTLIPLPLHELHSRIRAGIDVAGLRVPGSPLRSSIETALHAVIPCRVVVHAHSIRTISWAVRRDGEQRVAERLAGLRWHWIPYKPSGLPLAWGIEAALAKDPSPQVFVLANHGLVVCANDCEEAEELLAEVERRLSTTARPDRHGLPDTVGMKVLQGGVLYPCQAIFLDFQHPPFPLPPALPLRTPATQATFLGLVEVLQRIPEGAPIRYLTASEVAELSGEGTHAYVQSAEESALEPLPR